MIALIAFHYGGHFVRALRHPGEYYLWIVGVMLALAAVIATAVLMRRQLATS
jgi:hypothetical protein